MHFYLWICPFGFFLATAWYPVSDLCGYSRDPALHAYLSSGFTDRMVVQKGMKPTENLHPSTLRWSTQLCNTVVMISDETESEVCDLVKMNNLQEPHIMLNNSINLLGKWSSSHDYSLFHPICPFFNFSDFFYVNNRLWFGTYGNR